MLFCSNYATNHASTIRQGLHTRCLGASNTILIGADQKETFDFCPPTEDTYLPSGDFELDFRVGLSSWIFELDSRVGFSSWILELDFRVRLLLILILTI